MRLFIAIELDPPIRRAAYELALELRESVAGRAVREDNMHLTLAFLGEQPGGRLGALRKCMERAAAGSFGLELGNVGRFRRSRACCKRSCEGGRCRRRGCGSERG